MKSIELGTWLEIPNPLVAHILLNAGLDFVIVDIEHGMFDLETITNINFAVKSMRKKIYVRIPNIEYAQLNNLLDSDCDGVILPAAVDPNKVISFHKSLLYPPHGSRGFNPYTTQQKYGSQKSPIYNSFFLGIIIENIEGLNNLDKFLEYDGIDLIYIGIYDLSLSIGIDLSKEYPTMVKILSNISKSIALKGKNLGCMVHDVEEANRMVDLGFDFLVYKVDTGLIYDATKSFVRGFGHS